MSGTPWTQAEIDLLVNKYPDTPTKELAVEMGRTERQVYSKAAAMGVKKSEAYLASPAASRLRRGDNIGAEFRFEKGHVPANKGLRRPGWAPGRMAETQFKRGEMAGAAQHNYVPIGSLRVTRYGSLERKVTDDPSLYPAKRWRPVAHLVWEAAHGQIPPKHVVRFRPGMQTTVEDEITLDRLECISLADNMRRNSYHNYPPEIAKAIQLRGALNRKINNVEKQNNR